jgi:hypothetical protein
MLTPRAALRRCHQHDHGSDQHGDDQDPSGEHDRAEMVIE